MREQRHPHHERKTVIRAKRAWIGGGAILLVLLVGAVVLASRSTDRRAEKDHILSWFRSAPKATFAADISRGAVPIIVAFPNEFDLGKSDEFYVVFNDGGFLETVTYASVGEHASQPRWRGSHSLGASAFLEAPGERYEVWDLRGSEYVRRPGDEQRETEYGPRFITEAYNVRLVPGRKIRARVGAEVSNLGDGAGKAVCRLLYGSQAPVIRGHYMKVEIAPGDTFWITGTATFPRRLDDYESDDVVCRRD